MVRMKRQEVSFLRMATSVAATYLSSLSFVSCGEYRIQTIHSDSIVLRPDREIICNPGNNN